MKRKFIMAGMLLLFCSIAGAQLYEDFGDGNFTDNPAWTGSNSDWFVNNNGELQSLNTIANTSFYITIPSSIATMGQWEFSVKLLFNTSSSNYTDIFLTATDAELTAATNSGYFVRIGNSADEICLYKKSGPTITRIIDGEDGITNSSSNSLKIKVTRDAADQWTLFRDITNTGNNYVLEGNVTDGSISGAGYFGILVKQSTVASFAQRHFFDDIIVKTFVPDEIPPAVQSVTVTSNHSLDVLFSEPVDVISSQVAAGYIVNGNIGSPATALRDIQNNALVHLSFSNPFPNGTTVTLTVNGVKDITGNELNGAHVDFNYYTPKPYDVVIDEIMADPSPPVALPNCEWVELKNNSPFAVKLDNWQLHADNNTSNPFPPFTVQPDSFVIICSSSSASLLSPFAAVLPVSNFPSLNNGGAILSLRSANGAAIHAVQYSSSWYKNELKQEGGWSLEMIDSKNPCTGYNNWIASEDINGGTPGRKNSADALNADNTPPQLLRAYCTDSVHIVLLFNEPLDSISASTATNYTVSENSVSSAAATGPLFNTIILTCTTPLTRNRIYDITANAVTDCTGNSISTYNKARAGLAETATAGEIIINEILFNPPTDGADYAELYNRSSKILDLSKNYIATRNSTGTLTSVTAISDLPFLFFPGELVVISENTAWIKKQYVVKQPGHMITIGQLPSFNDDEGTVVILNAQGNITDELKYSDKWHFKLLNNTEAVALERIDYNAATQNADNWHSAASAVNYGTPTGQNSQFHINDGVKGSVNISPAIVSPDNDGIDDFATIDYEFPDPGYVANITVYDAAGRPVKLLQRNALCGTKGSFRWDGLAEKGQQLSTGVYIIFTEVFNLQGKIKQFKKAVVVARRS